MRRLLVAVVVVLAACSSDDDGGLSCAEMAEELDAYAVVALEAVAAGDDVEVSDKERDLIEAFEAKGCTAP